MHPNENVLRAYIDKELPAVEIEQVQQHLDRCPACQAQLDRISQQAEQVNARFAVMAPGRIEQPQPSQLAYQRFMHNPHQDQTQKETIKPMFKRRTVWTALAVIAVIALVFTLTPANAWASSFLGLFRAQKVQVITFDAAAAQNAQGKLDANQAAIKQVFKEDLKVSSHGDAVTVASAAEAAQKAGFTPRIPSALANPEISVRPGMNATFTINQPKLQALMDAVGVDAKLPTNTNGKVVTADVADAVVTTSADCPKAAKTNQDLATSNCTALVQLPSPVVNTPDGLNVQQLGQAMFQFLGMPVAEAQQVSQKIDWTSTLILPIPQSGDLQYQEVQVDGVTGTFLKETAQDAYGLVWVKDGILYGLHGPGGLTDAQRVAGSLH